MLAHRWLAIRDMAIEESDLKVLTPLRCQATVRRSPAAAHRPLIDLILGRLVLTAGEQSTEQAGRQLAAAEGGHFCFDAVSHRLRMSRGDGYRHWIPTGGDYLGQCRTARRTAPLSTAKFWSPLVANESPHPGRSS